MMSRGRSATKIGAQSLEEAKRRKISHAFTDENCFVVQINFNDGFPNKKIILWVVRHSISL